ncbi:sensor histidine kinase [Microbacterium murale]|nr:histidine kinase [Microbacterium murale]
MLVVIGGVIAVDVAGIVFSYGPGLFQSLLSIATTIVFALYLWSPWVATASLGIVFALSFIAGTESESIFAAAVAVGLVMRLGRTALIFSYIGAFLVATAIVAYGDSDVPVNVGAYLIIAAAAGAVGFALRIALDKGRRLEQELAEQAEHEREAVLAERRWIAGELHDSIAHHLTIVALHVQMLDDAERSRGAQEAIRIAAKRAMTDLRFVIDLADDGPRSSAVHSGDLAAAIDEARGEIEAAGHRVRSEGDPYDERIHRAGEIILARIMRESATNILKHAGPGEVSIRLDVDDESLTLGIHSPLPETARRDLPSSRTGVNRMAERVLGASGQFSAGAVDGQWRVSASLPIN